MNIAARLLENGAPDSAVCLLTRSGSYTHGEVRNAASNIAQYLLQHRASKGDRAILCAENSFFWVSAYLGSILAGCVAVPVPPNSQAGELREIIKSAEPRFSFLQARHAARIVSQLPPDCSVVTDQATDHSNSVIRSSLCFEELLSSTPAAKWQPAESDESRDLAALMFTSGSTRTPRGVMVSHRNIAANTNSIVEYVGLTRADRVLAMLPFYYCFGTSLLHTHLHAGASLVLDGPLINADKILAHMQETGCTGFAGVPSHFQILLRNSNLKRMRFPKLQWIQQAGGRLAPALLKELRDSLPGVRVIVMYGQTEATARLSYLPPELLDQKSGSIGKGIPGVHLEVLNAAGTPVRRGEVGEIVAQGENVTLGYWRDPRETSLAFRDGKLYTGDLATVDHDGFIYVVARAKDFVKCAGTRIGCGQVEDMLLGFPDIVEAAVVGIPDELFGEAVQAFVVPRGGAAAVADRLERFCRDHFPPHLVPKQIVVLDALPKNEAGKILKAALRTVLPADTVGAGTEKRWMKSAS